MKKTIGGSALLCCGTLINIYIFQIASKYMVALTSYKQSLGVFWQSVADLKLVVPIVIGSFLMILGIIFIIYDALTD